MTSLEHTLLPLNISAFNMGQTHIVEIFTFSKADQPIKA
jgi:hypothetical protein